ncbi:MAG: hypothetical protein IPM24_25735 [Bryobacterales bacterium]|nr:hypothetical protein [Bryobacterales bacterium]
MELQYTKLQQETADLQQTFELLAAELAGAARQIVNPGMCPPESLAGRISEARQQFEAVRAEVHGLAEGMMVQPLPALDELADLGSLQRLLESAAAAENNRRGATEEQTAALAVLARILTIAHREKKEFAPLAECHAATGELRDAIAGTAWPERHPDAAALVAGTHPLNSLLTLLDQADDLDEEQWVAQEDAVAALFGRTLVVAASRGKLEFSAGAAPVAEAEEPAVPEPAVAEVAPVPAAAAESEPVEEVPAPEAAAVEQEPEPVAAVEPEPVATAEPEPEPTAEPEPVAVATEPEPERAHEADLVAFAEAVAAEAEPIPVAAAQSLPEPAAEAPEPLVISMADAAPEQPPARVAEAAASAELPAFPDMRIGPAPAEGDDSRRTSPTDPQRPQRWGFWRGSR